MVGSTRKLRVLIVDGVFERLREVTTTVITLGHEVVGEGADLETVGHVTVAALPDVALVIVGENSDQALELIRTIVRESACPVIAILDVQDRAFIDQAARLGIFSYIAHAADLQEMQSSIDIALERFAEYHALEGAFGRRAVTERAKGILMERHTVDEERAFQILRDEARRTQSVLIEAAQSIIDGKPQAPEPERATARGSQDV